MSDPKHEPAILRRPRRVRYLKLIALFKIVKGVLALALGFSLLFLNSRTHWLDAISDWTSDELLLVHSKVVLYMLNKLQAVLANGQLRAPGLLALFYSAVLFTEGIGVYLQKRWAEFLMVFATGCVDSVRNPARLPPAQRRRFCHSRGELLHRLVLVPRPEAGEAPGPSGSSTGSLCRNKLTAPAGYSEGAQNARGFFHRQANHVAVRSFDSLDDFHAVTLRGVRAGFVERVYFRQILRNGALVEPAKMHPRYFLKAMRPPAGGMANED